jgi:hypothetical protein
VRVLSEQRATRRAIIPAVYMTWPIVGLILGLVFVVSFHGPIAGLLNRIRKIGPTGVEADSAAAAQEKVAAQEGNLKTQVSPGAEELLQTFDNQVVLEAERNVRTDLEKRKIVEQPERERVLIRVAAVTGICFLFERAYVLIFGSQLWLLQALNSAVRTKQEILPIYTNAKAAAPQLYSQYSFEQWLNFLVSQSLILINGETVAITVRGREFLKYLIQEGHTLQKTG